jgi:hypothetical protein
MWVSNENLMLDYRLSLCQLWWIIIGVRSCLLYSPGCDGRIQLYYWYNYCLVNLIHFSCRKKIKGGFNEYVLSGFIKENNFRGTVPFLTTFLLATDYVHDREIVLFLHFFSNYRLASFYKTGMVYNVWNDTTI